jgi:hypothetical protein
VTTAIPLLTKALLEGQSYYHQVTTTVPLPAAANFLKDADGYDGGRSGDKYGPSTGSGYGSCNGYSLILWLILNDQQNQGTVHERVQVCVIR